MEQIRLTGTHDIATRLGVTPARVIQFLENGQLPQPLPSGTRAIIWDAAVVEPFIVALAHRPRQWRKCKAKAQTV